MQCPICGKTAGVRPANPYGPFCSERCRLIDLGKWLVGDYRIPMEEPTEEDVEEARRNQAEEARRNEAEQAEPKGGRRERGAARKPS